MRFRIEAPSTWVALLLAALSLSVSCASPLSGRGLGAPPGTWAQQRGEPPLRPLASPPPLVEPKYPLPPSAVASTRQALLGALLEISSLRDALSSTLAELSSRQTGIGGVNGFFLRHVSFGSQQLLWLNSSLDSASSLVLASFQVEDEDMQWALLRLAGPRLQSSLLGVQLLASWVDLLLLNDAILSQVPAYSVESLIVQFRALHQRVAPSFAALASLEPEPLADTAESMPLLVAHLASEYSALRERARVASENSYKVIQAVQLLQALPMLSALRFSLPSLPPAQPLTVGVGLAVGSNGVMAGTRIVVSAEWVERMRQLVQAGVISIPVVSSAIQIHAGHVVMAQANHQLPRGVREALGEGPEVRAMHATNRAGAGMAAKPRHHVLVKEHREWFEKRGFTGDMDIDNFCVEVETAHHQAVHGGGNWRLGRTWTGEWNRIIMKALFDGEKQAGRLLTPSEILNIVAERMKDYGIPIKFTPWRGR